MLDAVRIQQSALPQAHTQPIRRAGVAGDERVARDSGVTTASRTDHRERPDVAARDDDRTRTDRAATLEVDRGDLPVIGPGELAVGRDRAG